MIRTLAARAPLSILSSSSAAPAEQRLRRRSSSSAMPRRVRIAVVGDVHDEWSLEEDSKALHFLQPDLVLFTGDFGNENVELVRSISNLKIRKAAILGNHDCWRTHQFSQKKADRVQLQLESLGEVHVGYSRLDFPPLKLSVVGGRPFSRGGDNLFRKNLLIERYGVKNMVESAKKVYEAASGTPNGHAIIVLGHNGPTGLGSRMNDICGRDWVYGGGDHGDPDLAQAISDVKSHTGYPIPLVVFGHMHSRLQYGNALRKMVVVGDDNTIYLNGAVVPRVKYEKGSCSGSNDKGSDQPQSLEPKECSLRAFTLVEFLEGSVEKISQTWVLVAGDKLAVEAEEILFQNIDKLAVEAEEILFQNMQADADSCDSALI